MLQDAASCTLERAEVCCWQDPGRFAVDHESHAGNVSTTDCTAELSAVLYAAGALHPPYGPAHGAATPPHA
jgi:hypothetical protein